VFGLVQTHRRRRRHAWLPFKEYTFKITGGSGKYQGASGGGTYIYESLTDILSGGRYNGKIELP
jgi:hypothetical protein